jgi:uncharacterized membrane protein (GlpM family)
VSDVLVILAKGIAGGVLVVAFAMISETLKPKRFAGLFGAAPAVAIAGLAIVIATKPVHDVHEEAIGMLAGCAGLVAYAAVVSPMLLRLPPLAASAAALVIWLVVAGIVAVPLLA